MTTTSFIFFFIVTVTHYISPEWPWTPSSTSYICFSRGVITGVHTIPLPITPSSFLVSHVVTLWPLNSSNSFLNTIPSRNSHMLFWNTLEIFLFFLIDSLLFLYNAFISIESLSLPVSSLQRIFYHVSCGHCFEIFTITSKYLLSLHRTFTLNVHHLIFSFFKNSSTVGFTAFTEITRGFAYFLRQLKIYINININKIY